MMENVWRDIRFGWRTMWRNPGFSAVAILALALGIGATSSVLSVVSGVLLGEQPYPHSDRLVILETVWRHDGEVEAWPGSYHDIRDWRERTADLVDDLATYSYPNAFNILTGGEADRVDGEIVDSPYLRLLGIEPILGRTFTADEDETRGAPYHVILGYDIWQQRYGGESDALGKTLLINEKAYEIIGVLPRGFRGLTDAAQIWLPLMMTDELLGSPRFLDRRGARWLQAAARLKPGVATSQAQSQFDSICTQLAEEYPGTNEEMFVDVKTVADSFYGDLHFPLMTLLGSAFFVLLIACTTIANLLLARATERQREMAMRAVQGADRPRLLRQLVTESLVLAVTGSVLGLLLAHLVTRLLVEVSAVTLKSYTEYSLDPPLVAAIVAIAVVCGIAFGLAPAWMGSRENFTAALREGAATVSRSRQRFQGALVATEVALAFFLLIAAGLLIKGFNQLQQRDLGIKSDQLLTVRVDLKGDRYADVEPMTTLVRQYLEGVESVPGVAAAGVTAPILPCDPWIGMTHVIEDRMGEENKGQELLVFNKVSPGYFSLMGMPLIKGRDFTEADTPSTELVAIIDEALAEKLWPGGDALGKRLRFGRRDPNAPWRTVVGVVRSVRHEFMQELEWPGSDIYYPIQQFPPQLFPHLHFTIRPDGVEAMSLASQVVDELHAVAPDLPPYDVATMDDRLTRFLAKERFLVLLMSLFATLALFLAMVGLYGVISYAVAQRRREIGLRIAVGGQKGDIVGLILRRAGTLVVIGLLAGLVAALVLGKAFESLLFGLSPLDWPIYAGTALALSAISLLAAWVPTRRALRMDPANLLRSE